MVYENILGVVLCGGKSVRMKRDKAFITYHTLPQYAYVANQLHNLCQNTVVSCNQSQLEKIADTHLAVTDNAGLMDIGPMRGLLSIFDAYPTFNYLVIGCDYPYLTLHDLEQLVTAKSDMDDVVCFGNNQNSFKEPTLALYDNRCTPLLWDYYYNSKFSLQQFLNTVNTKVILPTNANHIISINTEPNHD